MSKEKSPIFGLGVVGDEKVRFHGLGTGRLHLRTRKRGRHPFMPVVVKMTWLKPWLSPFSVRAKLCRLRAW